MLIAILAIALVLDIDMALFGRAPRAGAFFAGVVAILLLQAIAKNSGWRWD